MKAKRYIAKRMSQRYWSVFDNEAGKWIEDFESEGRDVESVSSNPRDMMKLAETLNANPDMPRPQTKFHARLDALLGY